MRGLTVALAAALSLGGVVTGATMASAAPAPITGLKVNSNPPEAIDVSWDAYSDPNLDHYTVVVTPGFYTKSTTSTSATISDLNWGRDYTVTVSAVSTDQVTTLASASLDIPGTKLSAYISKAHAVRGSTVKVYGNLKWVDGTPIKRAKLVVQAAFAPFPPYNYERVGATKTTRKGRFSLSTTADRTAVYRVLFKRAGTAGGWDGSLDIAVSAPVSLRFSSNPASVGQKVTFSGAVKAPGSLVAGARVHLQEKVNGRWKTVKSGAISGVSGYSLVYAPTSRVDHYWRVTTPAGPSLATSSSRARLLTVN